MKNNNNNKKNQNDKYKIKMLQICINVGIFSFPRLGTSVNLSHDVPPLSKQLITVDDPIFFLFFLFFFCSLGGCTYPSLLPAKDPLIRSDPYPKQNRVSLSPSSSERKGFPPPPKNKQKHKKKHLNTVIVSKGNPHAFRGCVDPTRPFRTPNARKSAAGRKEEKSQVPNFRGSCLCRLW